MVRIGWTFPRSFVVLLETTVTLEIRLTSSLVWHLLKEHLSLPLEEKVRGENVSVLLTTANRFFPVAPDENGDECDDLAADVVLRFDQKHATQSDQGLDGLRATAEGDLSLQRTRWHADGGHRQSLGELFRSSDVGEELFLRRERDETCRVDRSGRIWMRNR